MSRLRRPVDENLRRYRAETIEKEPHSFQLLSVDGWRFDKDCPLFDTITDALDRARVFGASVCRIREWAGRDHYRRVHVETVDWLLSWERVNVR